MPREIVAVPAFGDTRRNVLAARYAMGRRSLRAVR
jgi:hypothetical protein